MTETITPAPPAALPRAVRPPLPWPAWWAAAALALAGAAVAHQMDVRFGELLFAAIAAGIVGLAALGSPVLATTLLLVVELFLIELRSLSPVDLLKPTVALLLASLVLAVVRRPTLLRVMEPTTWAMAAYLAWNIASIALPHELPPGAPATLDTLGAAPFSPARFVLLAVALPFLGYVVGRRFLDRPTLVLWVVLAAAAYSAVVSILPFTPLTSLAWPRYVLYDERWPERAIGVVDQPVENGIVLGLGLAIGAVLGTRRHVPVVQRAMCLAVALACAGGMYLTHTRAVFLCGPLVLVLGAVLLTGRSRLPYLAGIAGLVLLIAARWQTFISTDRQAGGVGSPMEIQDRLNLAATALWGFAQHPWFGWGIGRFAILDTVHHQQWSPTTPWERGFEDVSHQNELGILAELGLVGLIPWLCVLALLALGLWRAYRALPDVDTDQGSVVVVGIMALAMLVVSGLTVDLRYFAYSLTAVFLLVGLASRRPDDGG